MVEQEYSVEKKIGDYFSDIEKRISISFQLVKRDLENLNERLDKLKKITPSGEILDLKEKLAIKFSDVKSEIEGIKSNFIKKEILDDEKARIDNEIAILKKQVNMIEKEKEDALKDKDKEIASFKGQINWIKGRINLLQSSVKNQEKEEKVENKEIFYKNKKTKKLPLNEEVKYNKDGVNPGFISKIIDGLSEE